MDEQAREEIAAAAAAHGDLGREYHGALAEGLVERISSEIDRQVDVRLAQYGVQPPPPSQPPPPPQPARATRRGRSSRLGRATEPPRTSRSGWANVVMGLGSVSLGVAATSVTLHAWAGTTAHATSVVYAARPLHQVVQTIQSGGSQVGAAAIVLVAFIWVAIAVINIAYARRQADRA